MTNHAHDAESAILADLAYLLREVGLLSPDETRPMPIGMALSHWSIHLFEKRLESGRTVSSVLAEILERLSSILPTMATEKEVSSTTAEFHILTARIAQILHQPERCAEHLQLALNVRPIKPLELFESGTWNDSFCNISRLILAGLPISVLQPRLETESKLFSEVHSKLFEINKKMHSSLDLRRLLSFIIDALVELTGAERGYLLLKDPKLSKGESQVIAARSAPGEDIEEPFLQMSKTIFKQVIEKGKTLLVKDALADRRLGPHDSIERLHLRSVLCAPLQFDGNTIGALYVDHLGEENRFRDQHLEIVAIFGEQAAVAIRNTQLIEEHRKKHDSLHEKLREIDFLNRRLERELTAQTLELKDFQQMLETHQEHLQLKYRYDRIIGGLSARMRNLYKVLDRVTASDATVHIFGESGTGKELVARAIHSNGPRSDKGFVSINCSAIPDELLESELFGHERGAFTSAIAMRRGLFEVADSGTLFLDEVGDMSSEMQVKLLRVLEEKKIRRVGGATTISVNVRVISASNRDLQQMVVDGRFRQDLFFRLNVIMITLPPLRERIEDLELLVKHLLLEIASDRKISPKKITRAALNHLEKYGWPGNVRELRNVLERCVVMTDGPQIDYRNLPEEVLRFDQLQDDQNDQTEFADLVGLPYDDAIKAFERRKIELGMRASRGNVLRCASMLDMQRSTLRRKIEEYQIDPREFKK